MPGIVMPGTGPGTGPIVPAPLPSLGINTYTHRYSGVRLDGANGAAVTSWTDSGSSPAPLNTDSGSGTITKNSTGDYPFAVLNGKSITNNIVETLPSTVGMLVRKATVSQNFALASGAGFTRAGNGNAQIVGWGGAGNVTTTLNTTGWMFVIATLQAGAVTQYLRANNLTASGTMTPGTPVASSLGSSTAGQTVDVAEFVIWGGLVMDVSQRLAVYDAVKAAYPLLSLP